MSRQTRKPGAASFKTGVILSHTCAQTVHVFVIVCGSMGVRHSSGLVGHDFFLGWLIKGKVATEGKCVKLTLNRGLNIIIENCFWF